MVIIITFIILKILKLLINGLRLYIYKFLIEKSVLINKKKIGV